MPGQGQRKGTFAILGLAAVAVVGTLVAVLLPYPLSLFPDSPTPGPQGQQASHQIPSQPTSPDRTSSDPVSSGQASHTQASNQPSAETPPAPAQTTPASSETAASASSTPALSKEPEKPSHVATVPSFDVVRVEPEGDSVIAGRAAPGATIELLRDGQTHARTVADASGLFALVPPPLPPGSHEIVLQSIAPDGTRQRSRESVTVVVDGKSQPLVALMAPDKPAVLLSSPDPHDSKPLEEAAKATPEPAQAVSRPEIKITSVETEESGRLFVSGQAAPGATVRLYLNETFIAPGGAGTDGKFSFAIGRGMQSGDYRVRLDDVDPVSGSVKSRAEVPFNIPVQEANGQSPGPLGNASSATAASGTPDTKPLPDATVVIPDISTTIVSRGDSLWRISRRIYGEGYRYTVIYGANQKQIRNPDMIYPGQVFVLPADQAQN